MILYIVVLTLIWLGVLVISIHLHIQLSASRASTKPIYDKNYQSNENYAGDKPKTKGVLFHKIANYVKSQQHAHNAKKDQNRRKNFSI